MSSIPARICLNVQQKHLIIPYVCKIDHLAIGCFEKPQTNYAFCIIIKFNFRKTGKNLIPENCYRKRMCSYLFWSLQKLWWQMLGLYFMQI